MATERFLLRFLTPEDGRRDVWNTGLEWPPPERLFAAYFVTTEAMVVIPDESAIPDAGRELFTEYRRTSYSGLSDEVLARSKHLVRGAEYEPAS